MLKSLRKNFFTGLIVIFPALVTVWIVQFIVVKLNLIALEPATRHLEPYVGGGILEYLVKIALLILIVLVIAFIGFGTRLLFLTKFFSYWERKIYLIPMIGKIYSATREMSQAFLGQSKGIFTRVVLVEFPRPGVYAIGFVTSEGKGEVQDKTIEKVINVFVPTTPNPTSGFLLLVPEEQLIKLDMSIDEGLKLVISGGIVPLPERVSIKKKAGP